MVIIIQFYIKNRTYYFFNDMIRIADLNQDLVKIGRKLYKNIDIYYIGYVTIKNKDHANIYYVNLLYFVIDETDGNIEEKNGDKYLILLLHIKRRSIDKIHTTIGWDYGSD